MKQKTKGQIQRLLSGVMSALLLVTALPSIPAKAQVAEGEKYPYTVFAGSYEEGAITVNAGNFCINGSVATNGTIVASGNMNINGERKEAANEEMIYIPGRLDEKFFSGHSVELYSSDYSYEETNIHVNNPMDVEGRLELIGNININSSVRAEDDIVLTGEVKNVANSVIYSEAGDIIIEGNNVNLTGLLYAPYGEIVLAAQNMNLNSVIIIGDKVIFDCPNVNANYDSKMAELIGTVSEGNGNSSDADMPGDDTEDVSGGDSGGNSEGGSTEEKPETEDKSDQDVSGGDIPDGINTVTMLYAVGEYNADTNSVEIQWHSDGICAGYEIFSSDDGVNYTSVATVSEGTTWQYVITEAFEEKYFKVSTASGQENEIESLPFTVCRFEDGYVVMYTDSDGDGLEDIFELALGLDIHEQDSEGDSLTDFQEFCMVGTDPAVYDSVCAGVPDAEADADGDGLTTVQEMTYETDYRNEDTDNDTLTDYEEVFVYQTNPLKWDSDGDTLLDGEEIVIGLDPDNPQTYGVPDAEYQVDQSFVADSELLAAINTDESPYQLSVDITAAGNAADKLDVRVSGYAATIENDFMLGVAPELIYDENAQVGSVTLKFEIEQSYIEDSLGLFPGEEEMEGIKRFNVFRYFEDAHMLLPIATEFDVENNCVYATTDEVGTYCVMDMELWINSFDVPKEVYQESASTFALRPAAVTSESSATTDAEKGKEAARNPIEAVFMLQAAGNAKDAFVKQRDMIVNLLEMLTEKYDSGVKFCVIVYDEEGTRLLKTVTGSIWFTSANELKQKLSSVTYQNTMEPVYRSGAYSLASFRVAFSGNTSKFLTMLENSSTWFYYSELADIRKFTAQGVHFSEIKKFGISYQDDGYAEQIGKLIDESGGLKSYYPGGDTQDILFNLMCECVEEEAGEGTEEDDRLTGTEFNVIVPTGWKTITLDGPVSSMSGTNSDTDSLSDYREIDVYSIKWNVSGDPILPTINQASGAYSYDGLERFKSEQWAAGMPSSAFEKRFDYILNNTYILPILSDPTTPDTDGDGLDDDVERELGTDPFTIDTDRDLVDDEEELSLQLNPLCDDTDGDGLFDVFELELWYDPTNANPDGDEYNDREEYYRGSDPYTYEVEVEVKNPWGQVWKGVIFGDLVEDEEVDGYVLIGQIAGGFVPVVADGRDVVANVSKGDILMAILSGAGFFPGLGDAAKGIGDLGQVIVKLVDDTPTITKLLLKTADDYPYLIRLFGESAIVTEALEEALGNPYITKEGYERLAKIAGKESLDVLSTPSSKVLRKNLIEAGVKEPDYLNAAHHIVAGSSSKAAEARAILRNFGIDINDAANGVFLPRVKGVSNAAYHPSLHTNAYYDEVNNLLRDATSKQEVLDVLRYISDSLQNGTFMK